MRPGVKNQLLQRLADEDFAALKPLLSEEELTESQVLSVSLEVIEKVHFIESGICSVQAVAPGSEAIEVGLIGREGVTGHVMEEGDSAALNVFVQLAGSSLAVPAKDYASWIRDRPKALRLMVRYQQAMITQVSFTALSHGSFGVEQRLARLLLMLFDRMDGGDGGELALVHDRLARMLSVRRAGVTTALHMLEGAGAIRSTRGAITLKDRAALEEMSAGAYGIPEQEYKRLLGPPSTIQQ